MPFLAGLVLFTSVPQHCRAGLSHVAAARLERCRVALFLHHLVCDTGAESPDLMSRFTRRSKRRSSTTGRPLSLSADERITRGKNHESNKWEEHAGYLRSRGTDILKFGICTARVVWL